MEIVIKVSEEVILNHYLITDKKEKFLLTEKVNILKIKDDTTSFYVKNYFTKTKQFYINNITEPLTLRNFYTIQTTISLALIIIILHILSMIFKSDLYDSMLMWFYIMVLSLFVYTSTFGRKYFIKIT